MRQAAIKRTASDGVLPEIEQARARAAASAFGESAVQMISAAGTVVAAGGAITPDAVVTVRGRGRIKVTATGSYSMPATDTVRPIIQANINGAGFVTEWSDATDTAPAAAPGYGKLAASFILTTAALPGQTVAIHWQTTAGDGPATLGGTGGTGAALIVEEIP
jgi:hypothetical protein